MEEEKDEEVETIGLTVLVRFLASEGRISIVREAIDWEEEELVQDFEFSVEEG